MFACQRYRGKTSSQPFPNARHALPNPSDIFSCAEASQGTRRAARDPREVPRRTAGLAVLEVESTADLKHALDWLDRAYRAAR
jgi:hypothetical protein